VPGVVEGRDDARRDLDRLAVANGLEERRDRLRIILVVQRLVEVRLQRGRLVAERDLRVGRACERGLLLRHCGRILELVRVGIDVLVAVRLDRGRDVALLVGPLRLLDGGPIARSRLRVGGLRIRRMPPLPAPVPLRELLLEPAAVHQDDLRELGCRARQVDRAGEALPDDDGQEPAMVEVRVGDEDRVKLGRVVPERDAVPDRLVRRALEHPAVDQDLRAGGREQEAGAGDGARATEKLEVHPRRARA